MADYLGDKDFVDEFGHSRLLQLYTMEGLQGDCVAVFSHKKVLAKFLSSLKESDAHSKFFSSHF